MHTVDHREGKNCKIMRKLLNDISEENYPDAVENRIDTLEIRKEKY